MKKIPFFSLLILFIIGFSVPSCYKGGECDGTPKENYFDIQGIAIINVKKNSFSTDQILYNPSEATLYNYILRIDFARRYYMGNNNLSKPQSFSFGNSVFACSPNPLGYLGSKEKLQFITITRKIEYEYQKFRTDTITHLFDFKTPLNNLNNYTINDYLTKDITIKNTEIDIIPKATLGTGSLDIEVILGLRNGEVYKASNKTIRIL